MGNKGPKWPHTPLEPKNGQNSEKVSVYAATRVERRTYASPDILRLKPENMKLHNESSIWQSTKIFVCRLNAMYG